MASVADKIAKYAAMAAGFAMPYVEEFIDVKKQTAILTKEIDALKEENSQLRSENESLKQKIVLSAVIAAASFAAFIAVLLVLIIR
ncbi:MAG: hypothetical protein FWG57_03865 [Endomicrobia bacterium]|nr:hypothetical protein [Bacillota bacterium]MCL1972109.1 hypothetical protein [Endomicrobiia bacterium]